MGQKRTSIFNVVLASIIIVMLAINIFIVCTYAKLTSSHPLQNIREVTVDPINTESPHIVFRGKYDRAIMCTLKGFTVLLINTSNQDTLMLNHNHLAISPEPNTGPGKDIDIKFALHTPKAIYAGHWATQFTGSYSCSNGMFTDQKTVLVKTKPFEVYDASVTFDQP